MREERWNKVHPLLPTIIPSVHDDGSFFTTMQSFANCLDLYEGEIFTGSMVGKCMVGECKKKDGTMFIPSYPPPFSMYVMMGSFSTMMQSLRNCLDDIYECEFYEGGRTRWFCGKFMVEEWEIWYNVHPLLPATILQPLYVWRDVISGHRQFHDVPLLSKTSPGWDPQVGDGRWCVVAFQKYIGDSNCPFYEITFFM